MLLVTSLCLVAGLVLGLLGGGGSILAVPIFVVAGRMEPRAAIATSLLVVGLGSAAAAFAHGRRGLVDVRAGLTLGLASTVGAYAGARLGGHLPEAWLLAAFTVVMAATAVAMLRPRSAARSARRPSARRTVAMGAVVGVVTGLVGAGGGFVLVPALMLVAGLPMRRAVGTSLLVIAMNSAAGFAGAWEAAPVDGSLVAVAAAATTSGALAGVAVSVRAPTALLRPAFGALVLVASVVLAARQVPADLVARATARLPQVGTHLAAALAGAAAVAVAWLVVHLRGTLARSGSTRGDAAHGSPS
jgi:uncharacterized membrane protein YfcA